MTDPGRALHWTILAAACLAIPLGCRRSDTATVSAPAEPPWFTDVTAEVGLDFVHDAGPIDGTYFLPQIMGSGAALLDMDNDGRLDIYLINNGGPKGAPNRLYRQRPDGTFEDVSAGSGLAVAGHGMGAAVGDINNDGLPDVYLTQYAGDLFFLNLGGGHFKEMTKQTGIDNPLWGTSASFVDCDRDGWLDLVVANYLSIDRVHPCTSPTGARDYCHPRNFAGMVTRLYRNRGCDAEGQWLGFEDRTLAAGLAKKPGPALGVVCADLNGDGWPDIFVAMDARPNHIWINQKDGTFTEEAPRRGLAYNAMGETQGNMGIAVGDVDGDRHLDLFVTHLVSEHHSLWKQGPAGSFRDLAAGAGLTRPEWRGTGFGTVLADFDHDGSLDLAIVNGAVMRAFAAKQGADWEPYQQRNQIFANDGRGSFRDVSSANSAFCGWAGVSRGLAVGDIDGDGALDLLVTQIAGAARLYRNSVPRRGHWLMIRALEKNGKRDALGANVTVEAGSQRWIRIVQTGFSYLCGNDPRVHFGLGNASRIDSVRVTWPDGTAEAFPGGKVDRLLVVRQGEGQPAAQGEVNP